jgi:hypothetical protein
MNVQGATIAGRLSEGLACKTTRGGVRPRPNGFSFQVSADEVDEIFGKFCRGRGILVWGQHVQADVIFDLRSRLDDLGGAHKCRHDMAVLGIHLGRPRRTTKQPFGYYWCVI